jgi:NAD(P)-dependent dehydrogenase (short-subunit alcohol dehydrogenase family)
VRLKDKVVIITGAGSGIGQETAYLFAREGAKVIVTDINLESGQETVDNIIKNNGNAINLSVDVTDPEQVKNMVNKAIDHYGRIDVLFNNAGISGNGLAHQTEFETWKKVIDVNINGVFLVSKEVLPHMMKQNSGSIINMASCIAEIGLADRASYATSKGAVLAMTKSMQVDYASYNIRLNALMPGTISTPFIENYLDNDPNREVTVSRLKARQLGGELGKPIDVAYAALYLASDESKFMMGSPLYIDGGVVNGKAIFS